MREGGCGGGKGEGLVGGDLKVRSFFFFARELYSNNDLALQLSDLH